VAEPGRQPAAGVVLHRLHLGRCAECVAHPLGGPLVGGREADVHMAVVEDRVVGPVGLFDLIQRLGDQEALDPIAGHEGKRGLEEVKAAQGRKLVEHQQEPPAPASAWSAAGRPD
jgi:hypothetical protein